MKRQRFFHYIIIHFLLFFSCATAVLAVYGMSQYLSNYSTSYHKYIDTNEFHQSYMKYIERLTFYIHYKDSGYNIDMYSPLEIEEILSSDDEGSKRTLKDKDGKEQEHYELYNYCLNIQDTNFLYYVINTDTNKVYASPYLSKMYPRNTSRFATQIQQNPAYFILNTKNGKYSTNIDPDYNILTSTDLSWMNNLLSDPIVDMNTGESTKYHYIIYTGILPDFSNTGDIFYKANKVFTNARTLYDFSLRVLPVTLVLILLSLMLLIIQTGKIQTSVPKRYLVNGIYLNWIDRIRAEFAAILILGSYLVLLFISSHDKFISLDNVYSAALIAEFRFCSIYPIFIIGFLTLVRRIKSKTLLTNSIICNVLKYIHNQTISFFKQAKITYRATAFLSIFVLLQIGSFFLKIKFQQNALFLIGIILSYVYLIGIFIRIAIDFGIVLDGTKKMQSGDLTSKLPTETLLHPVNELSSYINNISAGLSVAVEEQTKSERFKAELITNVSHDIKTPLTSIINYVDLLEKQTIENDKAKEYLEILSNKSWRLKTLIEDLVEASKASSGAIKMNLQKINLVELVKQAAGEFDDRFNDNQLDLVISGLDQAIAIYADGRSTYRIIDNLLSNINKYALPGTRVYADIAANKTHGILSIKNISRDKLNISPEELMERFVRGDVSRNTEGSGLGLSISRSLTTLQNGTFDIEVDGDLFKVIVSLPLYKQQEEQE